MGTIYGYVIEEPVIEVPLVYFIMDEHCRVKIGKTNNVLARINNLQTANADNLQYFFGVTVDTMDDATILENELHEMFSNNSVRGEWYEYKPVFDYLNQETCYTATFKFEGLNGG